MLYRCNHHENHDNHDDQHNDHHSHPWSSSSDVQRNVRQVQLGEEWVQKPVWSLSLSKHGNWDIDPLTKTSIWSPRLQKQIQIQIQIQLRHRSTYKDINPVPTVTKLETHSWRVHVSDNDPIWKLFLWLSSWPVKNRQSARRTGPQGTKCHILFQKLLGFTVVQEDHFETLVCSAPSLLFCTI